MAVDKGRYMVLGLNGVVLHDIVGTLEEGYPGLHPCAVTTEAEAIAHVAQAANWKFAFLNLGPMAYARSELFKMFTALGTQVVLLGAAAEEAAASCSYPVLRRPFTSDDILRALERKS